MLERCVFIRGICSLLTDPVLSQGIRRENECLLTRWGVEEFLLEFVTNRPIEILIGRIPIIDSLNAVSHDVWALWTDTTGLFAAKVELALRPFMVEQDLPGESLVQWLGSLRRAGWWWSPHDHLTFLVRPLHLLDFQCRCLRWSFSFNSPGFHLDVPNLKVLFAYRCLVERIDPKATDRLIYWSVHRIDNLGPRTILLLIG